MRSLFLAALLLISSIAEAQTKIFPGEGKAIALLRSDEAKSQWSVIAIDFDKKQITPIVPTLLEDGGSCLIEGSPGSQCAVMRYGHDGIQREALVVTLGGAKQTLPTTPPDTTVPGPTTPNPQVPVPGTPLTGMRVLILEETSSSSAPPKNQVEALHSPMVMAYLDSKMLDSMGNRRWRRLDPNVPLTNLPKIWQDMRAAINTSTDSPQVVIAGSLGGVEKIVYAGPYPTESAEAALAFFKKWGG